MAAVAGGDAVAPGGCGRGGVGRRGARDPARRGAATGDAGRGGPRGAVVAGDGGGSGLHRRGVPEPDPVGELPDVSGVAGGRALRRGAGAASGARRGAVRQRARYARPTGAWGGSGGWRAARRTVEMERWALVGTRAL